MCLEVKNFLLVFGGKQINIMSFNDDKHWNEDGTTLSITFSSTFKVPNTLKG